MGSTENSDGGLIAELKSLAEADRDGAQWLYVGGITARMLRRLLVEQRAFYQGWLLEPGTDCERDIASLRLIMIEEVLGQMGGTR